MELGEVQQKKVLVNSKWINSMPAEFLGNVEQNLAEVDIEEPLQKYAGDLVDRTGRVLTGRELEVFQNLNAKDPSRFGFTTVLDGSILTGDDLIELARLIGVSLSTATKVIQRTEHSSHKSPLNKLDELTGFLNGHDVNPRAKMFSSQYEKAKVFAHKSGCQGFDRVYVSFMDELLGTKK